MSGPAIPRADDVFHCPDCGQKHRGDLSAPRAGAQIRAKCAGCGVVLWIRWKRGRASVRVAELGTLPSWTVTTSQLRIPANLSRTAALVGAISMPMPTGVVYDVPADDDRDDDGDDDAPAAAPARREVAPAPGAPEFTEGAVIGRYRVMESIGRGGTGSVYRAFDATTNRYVALKILGAEQPDVMRHRFLREIEVQANLRHPNLMPVFDRGEHGGRPFFTMEMLYRPFSLTEIVRMGRDGSLARYATLKHLASPEAVVREIFLPVCEAMQVASVENGVVHRDLKPDNVLVDSRTLRPYVIDFGICHVLERRERVGGVVLKPTADDAGIVGTPRYLAPEQSRGSVHERTDLWGLGAILRFCLTGEPPIAGAQAITRAELKRRVRALTEAEEVARREGDERKVVLCAEKLARLEDTGLRTYDDVFEDAREGVYTPLPPEAPSAAVAILRKAMALRPADRYENPRALAADVEAWLSGAPTQAEAELATRVVKVAHGVQSVLRREVAIGAAALVVVVGAFLLGRGAAGRSAETERAATARTVLAGLEAQVDAAARLDPTTLAPAEAARAFDALRRDVALAEPVCVDDDAAARWRAVSARVAPTEVVFDAAVTLPDVVVEDLVRGGGRASRPGKGMRLEPGSWALTVGRVRIPVVVPLALRTRSAVEGRAAAPTLLLRVPVDPATVADDRVLVVPGTAPVAYRGAPWSSPAATATVAPFLLDRTEVTNADWMAFLEALPDDVERAKRSGALEFVRDLSRPGHFAVPRGVGADAQRPSMPVRGVSPSDALAYCAWRAAVEGVIVRLPTEAEWAVAAGAGLGLDLPAGAEAAVSDGVVRPVAPVAEVGDVGPFGVRGLYGNARELVVRLGTADANVTFLSKGAGAGDAPSEAAIRLVRPVGFDERHPRTGFRCVREVPIR